MPAQHRADPIPLEAPPQAGQSQDRAAVTVARYGDGPIPSQYAISVTLSDPYTFRANVERGMLAAVALFALGLSVLVAAAWRAGSRAAAPADRGVARRWPRAT